MIAVRYLDDFNRIHAGDPENNSRDRLCPRGPAPEAKSEWKSRVVNSLVAQEMVGTWGLEPQTSTVSNQRSNLYNPLAALLFRFHTAQKQPQNSLFLVTSW